jgi:hypothetical protein
MTRYDRAMAISDFHASTIVKVAAYFGFSEFAGDPDEITRVLGIQPDEVGRKGAAKRGRRGHIIHRPFNSWSMVSRSGSKDVNDHLRNLLDRLNGVASDLPKEFGEPTFSILWKGTYLYAGSGPFFETDVIAGIARLRASLWQDIYQVEPAGPESADAG